VRDVSPRSWSLRCIRTTLTRRDGEGIEKTYPLLPSAILLSEKELKYFVQTPYGDNHRSDLSKSPLILIPDNVLLVPVNGQFEHRDTVDRGKKASDTTTLTGRGRLEVEPTVRYN